MTALTTGRNTPSRDGVTFEAPVAAGKVIYAGALVCLDADGNATPGATATTLKGAGRAEDTVTNAGGAAGDVTVPLRRGVFRFANAGDVTRAHIRASAYAVDDQTVSASSATNTRSVIGTIEDVDAQGVWVRI
ncbi:conserved hypothetical protein [uncultured Alphaproteobacteria bacterium]|uniref:Bacteriophage protein n=1 Tax=uncultured Alphaproteobacteria bacterium TaxID=91750 RepID=A0A212KN14_9PROT|nr:conserved hypothetical protein [uncultured Alphaproteobacteria bacterium]